jgi:hypothetical protein
MVPPAIARLSAPQQRTLAVALLVAAVVAALVIVFGPIVLLHRHYDSVIADTSDRLRRYQRVAAQAPEFRAALNAMQQRDARRFFLKNTASNLAGAELQELVKTAIENNGGRITTSQNPGARDEGSFRQLTVNVQFFASTPALQKILLAIETHQPYLIVENLTARPLNAFRGFKPAPGQEPELNVQLDVGAWAYAEPAVRATPPAKT